MDEYEVVIDMGVWESNLVTLNLTGRWKIEWDTKGKYRMYVEVETEPATTEELWPSYFSSHCVKKHIPAKFEWIEDWKVSVRKATYIGDCSA